jgi:hypothetical protein
LVTLASLASISASVLASRVASSVGSRLAVFQHVTLQRVEPAIDDAPERAFAAVRRGDALDQAAVHRFQAMQRRLGFRDLHLAGRETTRPSSFLQPTAEEGLARAVFAADSLEGAASGRHGIQLFIERSLQAAITHGQRIQASLGHRAAPQGLDDLGSALRYSL